MNIMNPKEKMSELVTLACRSAGADAAEQRTK
jgi:hypothetical protein